MVSLLKGLLDDLSYPKGAQMGVLHGPRWLKYSKYAMGTLMADLEHIL